MKVMLFGAKGQVGRALVERLRDRFELVALDRNSVNLCDLHQVAGAVFEASPDVVINAAAYTNVDGAEADPDLARLINASAPGRMALATAEIGALLIHYSTDYVFDGTKNGAYVEGDTANPLNVYGATKLEGERLVASANGPYLTFRTSWVHSATGNSFAKKILNRAETQDQLRVVDDQFGAPTSAALIAQVTWQAVDRHQRGEDFTTGLYHLTASGETNWYRYAQEVLDVAERGGMQLKATARDIVPVSAASFAAPAKRPANSLLSSDKLAQLLGQTLPDWREDLRPTLDALIERSFQ